jgi:hypothetical protein
MWSVQIATASRFVFILPGDHSVVFIGSTMKRGFVCILAIAGWYLLYPPATQQGYPDSYTTQSQTIRAS